MLRSSTRALRKVPKIVSRYISDKSFSLAKRSYRERFPPLSCALPIVNHHLSLSPQEEMVYPTRITTLPNGLRIASENAPGPAACIGLYVNSGSIYETTSESGISHLLARLAFKDTKNRPYARIVREVELTGGNVGACASREQMGYCYRTLKAYIPQAVELLLDCVRNPIFLEMVVQRELAMVKQEIEKAARDPGKFLLDSLHFAGYTGALAKPLVASKEDFQEVNGSLEKFCIENYTADRMVLSASGVDHQDLLEIAEPLLHDLHARPRLEVPTSSYVGGELRHRADFEVTHVALAFEAPGGWHQDREASIVTVLQILMGGGGSFSSGGPGKGMHSRFYLRVLSNYPEIESFSAFSNLYKDTGLFGITFTTDPSFAGKAIRIAANELIAIATPGEVKELELNRAKNATRSAILMNLESGPIVAEDIGRQILTSGCRKPVEHHLECIDDITTEDIRNMAQKLLSTPLTVSCLGDVDSVPSYECILRFFKA